MDLEITSENTLVNAWSRLRRESCCSLPVTGCQLIHIPTGIVKTCDEYDKPDENKLIAIGLLQDALKTYKKIESIYNFPVKSELFGRDTDIVTELVAVSSQEGADTHEYSLLNTAATYIQELRSHLRKLDEQGYLSEL